MKIIAVDNGYYQTKVLADNKLYSFKSKYCSDSEGVYEYQGHKYSIGTGKYNINHDKCDNELHRLLTYYALSKATEEKEMFKLVLSLPILHYKNQRDSYKDYIAGKGLEITKLNDNKKVIVIDSVLVAMQGAGALYANNPEEYKNKLIAVWDNGGLTSQGCCFENLKPIPETMFSIDGGGIILNNKIKTYLNSKYGLNLQDYQIPHLEGYEKDKDYIIQEHIETITLEMKKHNWDIKTLPILATGGASEKMRVDKYLSNCFLSKDCTYDNVKGLYAMGASRLK